MLGTRVRDLQISPTLSTQVYSADKTTQKILSFSTTFSDKIFANEYKQACYFNSIVLELLKARIVKRHVLRFRFSTATLNLLAAECEQFVKFMTKVYGCRSVG